MPRFEVYRDKKGEWRYRLRASNGRIIAASEGYTRKDSVYRAVETLKRMIIWKYLPVVMEKEE